MIGQDYFDLRSRLGSALFALRGLAEGGAPEIPEAASLEKLAGGLKDPFVFIVVGEVNVGKSTLLNALFGADLTRTGVMPTTERILYFKHGRTPRRLALTRTLEEIHVPVDFLRDFHIVDTPGTNSIEGEHQAITERFVPIADLVIFVFSAMNPWGASAWRFLEKVHNQWMRKVIFVLQQSDLREPEEIQSILAYMGRLCQQRFGHEFPTYPVAAKKAFLARNSGVDCERLLAESGLPHLEGHISRIIGSGETRLAKLASALQSARAVLAEVDRRLASNAAGWEKGESAVRALEGELAAREERTFAELSHAIDAEEADFQHAARGLQASVAARLTSREALASVFRGPHPVEGLDLSLATRLGELGRDRWERALAVLGGDAGAAAVSLGQRLAEAALVAVPSGPDAGYWQARRAPFMARIDDVRRTAVAGLGLDALLLPAQADARRLARGQVIVGALAALAGAGLGLMGWWVAALLSAGGALPIVALIGWSKRRRLARVRRECEERLGAAAAEVRRGVEALLRAEVRAGYEPCSRLLESVRGTIAGHRRRHDARAQQAANLARTLVALDAELGGGVVTAG